MTLERSCLAESFAERNLISISFQELEEKVFLSNRKCALIFPISTENFGLKSLLTKTSSNPSISSTTSDNNAVDLNMDPLLPSQCESGISPTNIEVLIKRSEYADLVSALKDYGADLQYYQDEADEEASNSTVASIKSRMSTRHTAKVARSHVELSTKFGHQYPNHLLDINDYLINQITKHGIESPNQDATRDGTESVPVNTQSVSVRTEEEEEEAPIKECFHQEDSTIEKESLATPTHNPTQDEEQSQQRTERNSVAEITPLPSTTKYSSNTLPRDAEVMDGSLGPFDTVSAVLGVVDVSKPSKSQHSTMEDLLNDQNVQDIANAVRSYDDALSRVAHQMDLLVDAQTRLSGLTDSIDTRFISDAANLIRRGHDNRKQMKRANEMKVLTEWWKKRLSVCSNEEGVVS